MEVKRRICGPLAPVLTVYREGDLALDLDAIQENVDQQIRRGMVTGRGTLLAAGAGYFADSVVTLGVPGTEAAIGLYTFIGEVVFMVWLLVAGLRRGPKVG